MDVLPTEICLRIFQELPLTEVGVFALARCGIAGNGTLRVASLDPGLWKPYYDARYAHSEIALENERRNIFEGNWRCMYQERRRLDRIVLDDLDTIEACSSKARIEPAKRIAELGLDVWDVLSEEADRPPPTLFQTDEDIEKVVGGSPLTNLTRKYWATQLLKVIARRNAIDRWAKLKRYSKGEEVKVVSFEEAFASLSSFCGVLPGEITSLVDSEANRCKRYIEDNGIDYDPGAEGFETHLLCNAVFRYMRLQGFGRAGGPGSTFYSFRNSLPHFFLTSARHSLPISLVFLFVSILKRLGVEASPLNTPNVVTTIVGDAVLDVSHPVRAESLGFVESREEFFNTFTQAMTTIGLLSRVARNIIMARSFEVYNAVPEGEDVYVWHEAQYLSQCLLALFPDEAMPRDEMSTDPDTASKLFPLDKELVVRAKGLSRDSPYTSPYDAGDEDSIVAVSFDRDLIDVSSKGGWDCLFVGQIVEVERSSLRCIIGWKIKHREVFCTTIANRSFKILDFPVAAVKPRMCARGDLNNFLQIPFLGQFFEDAEFRECITGGENGRARFIMNKRMLRLYPDDDARGARYIRSTL